MEDNRKVTQSTSVKRGGTGSMYKTAAKDSKLSDPFSNILSKKSSNFQPVYTYQQSAYIDEGKRLHKESHKEDIIFKQHIENLPKLLSIRDNFKGPSMYRDQDSKHSQSGPLIGNRH